MRRIVILMCALTAVVGPMSAAGARVPAAIDECSLLTNAQARTIMQAKPYSDGAPDNGGCSWQTDPYDRLHLAYVTVEVQRRGKVLARYGDDLRRFLEESTNVGIDALADVGDEAFSVYAPLTGPGASSGIEVAEGPWIVSIGFQPSERVENPSPELSRIVKIARKVVAKLPKG